MRHVAKALIKYAAEKPLIMADTFIELENIFDEKGIAPIVKFTIQSDPVKEVGINGCQAQDMLHYVKCLFETLNESFPCRENSLTITKLEEALHWQDARTKNRILREVEGENKL